MKKGVDNDLRQRKYKKPESDSEPEVLSVFNEVLPTWWLPKKIRYGLMIVFFTFFIIAYMLENTFPNQIKLKHAESFPGRFIGERAELQLKRLTDLGTRVVGSYENEVLAVDFLKREISFIAQEASKNFKIEVDIQKPTGSYYLFLRPHGFRNYYANIQNVVVKLSSESNVNSVLLNCHYDTVPESPGASDNGFNCVVLLEILRVLATGKEPLKNNVIFLFNGAEENPLQASHGFLSQHKWKDEVKVVINLDSAGAGGRELLFQTSGESWLVKAYARAVPRPSGGVQGEEIFQYGIIPSDTDFRIFRDFAGYPGFDFAHCRNGYVYHTKCDTTDFIGPGVYQNTGDNILALVKELCNSSEVGITHSKSRLVYFDVFTLFMVVYTEEMGVVLNLATVLLSLYSAYKSVSMMTGVRRSFARIVCISTGGELIGLMLAGGVVYLTAKSLDFLNSTMSWYLRPWLIIPLYYFPIVFVLGATMLVTHSFMGKDLIGHRIICLLNGQFLWTFVLLLGTLKGVRTSFILMLFVLLPSVGRLLIISFRKTLTVRVYLVVYLCCLMFPLLFLVCQTIRIFIVIIPMTARMGPHTNPEMVIGGLAFLTATVCLSQLIPFLLTVTKVKKFLISLCVIHVFTMVAVTTTKFGFPYDGNLPAFQRFYVLHCERTFHDAKGAVSRSDSGVFVQSLDRNNVNYVEKFLPELHEAKIDCSGGFVFCGFPVFTSRFIHPAAHSYYIPIPPPTIHHPTSLEVVNQTQISVNVRRIRILVTGPDHVTVGLSPRVGVGLVKWSFDPTPPVHVDVSDDRKTYMVYYSHGLMGGTLEFDVDLEIGQNHSGEMMDVAVVGHYMHDKKFRTNEFTKILSRFPDWAHLTAWTTTYKNWVI